MVQDFEESLLLMQKNFDESIIREEKPDVVIIQSVERYVGQITIE